MSLDTQQLLIIDFLTCINPSLFYFIVHCTMYMLLDCKLPAVEIISAHYNISNS